MQVESLIREVLQGYELPWHDIHGLSHWGRVLDNGLRLAEATGADTEVVTLFAVFHDSRRLNAGTDPGHGRRGAELAASLRGSLFELRDREFRLLHEACSLHTDGLTRGDITVQTCWDADRLDLGRVGVTPWPERLCTAPAKDPGTIDWACDRAIREVVPDCVRNLWDERMRSLRTP